MRNNILNFLRPKSRKRTYPYCQDCKGNTDTYGCYANVNPDTIEAIVDGQPKYSCWHKI
jgi:hypothetical protein